MGSGCWTYSVAAIGLVPLLVAAVLGGEEVDFIRDVRPILSNHCFQCHGPDEHTREADLRLDQPAGLYGTDGNSGVVVPGDPDQSLLWQRITDADDDSRMPPRHANKPLSKEQIEVVRRWIVHGAQWRQHWAFVPPRWPEVPAVHRAAWCRTPVDRFVLSKLEEAGIEPAADASPAALLRRLYFDLLGLPPTLAEVERWTAELVSPAGEIDEEALGRLVDRLMASPHYGERWGQRWLDLARYADTNGYEKDRDRSIWPYRDWVIDVLNEDLPFDQFTIEQLAGDLLPDATLRQRVATGFHCNTMLNEEGGIDPLEFRFHAMTDRVATTGAVWLGLTIGCAQCHTHKFDPITHTEYYQLMALMNNTDQRQLELIDDAWRQRWEANRREADRLLAELPAHWPETGSRESGQEQAPARSARGDASEEPAAGFYESLRAAGREQLAKSLLALPPEQRRALWTAFTKWLELQRQGTVAWEVLRPVAARSSLPILTIQSDASIFASGDTAKRDDYYVDFAPVDRPVRAIRLEALPDERLPARGPGSTYYEGTLGDFFLTEFQLQADGEPVPIQAAHESFAANRFGNHPVSAALTIDGDVQTGWSVHGRQGERHVAVYLLASPIPAGKALQVHMVFGRHFASSLGRFRLSFSDTEQTVQARAYPDEVEQALLVAPETLSDRQWAILLEQFLLQAPQLQPHNDRLRQLRRRPPATTTLVMVEWPEGHRRPTFRHHRGEYLQPREEVEPATPEILNPWDPQWPKNRLGLARWLVDSRHPLTARVVVNRAWADFFGEGLVRTLEDFGLQGDAPTHPELLDWLAMHWMHRDGWSMKRLHRLIVTSRVYRLDVRRSPMAQRVDPSNRLLSSMPYRRLSAEQIRDAMLTCAGCVDRRFGGPPVRPPQQPGISEVAYGSPQWVASQGGDRFRRSIYTYKKRTAPFAFFSSFDAPSGESCTVRRVQSNTPLQALSLLNDVMVTELAVVAALHQHWQEQPPGGGRRGEGDEPTDEQLRQVLRRVLTRQPQADEVDQLRSLYAAAQRYYAEHGQEAAAVLAILPPSLQEQFDQQLDSRRHPQLAAWALVWRAAWALDEALRR
ncbi:MAG: hypothetical protein KatS3mg111_4065 [Pirellulaceae bacterium]|nr:MAG: hypothetical protein KatS3mg111_4065 [Pirellulaceae bacterium]